MDFTICSFMDKWDLKLDKDMDTDFTPLEVLWAWTVDFNFHNFNFSFIKIAVFIVVARIVWMDYLCMKNLWYGIIYFQAMVCYSS